MIANITETNLILILWVSLKKAKRGKHENQEQLVIQTT